MATKRKTNVQFVADLMDFSKSGALMQAFVIEALRHYAEITAEAAPWTNITFIDQGAWKACAKEVTSALAERGKS